MPIGTSTPIRPTQIMNTETMSAESMPTTLLQSPSVSQSLRTIPRTKKRTSMSWTTQFSASSLRLRKGWVCCCNVRSRTAMSNPTRSRRSRSSPPKLINSRTLVSTCQRNEFACLAMCMCAYYRRGTIVAQLLQLLP
eukprot:scaffold44705_cov70-Phaeocystis_antarctica.AAC.3